LKDGFILIENIPYGEERRFNMKKILGLTPIFIAFILALTACSPEIDDLSNILSIELRVNEALVQNNAISAFRGQELTFVPTLIGANETITEPTFTWSFGHPNTQRDLLRNNQETPNGSTVNNGVVTIGANELTTTLIRLNVNTSIGGITATNYVDIYVSIVPTNTTLVETFECENLAQIVAQQLGVSIHEPITTADLARITSLVTNGRNFSSLQGIEYLVNLSTLNLVNGQISDPSNRINDISPLENLTKLVDLNLNNNQIQELSPLTNLTSLRYVRINNNQISDLRPLGNLNLSWILASNQTINLETTAVGVATPLNLYLPNGTATPLIMNPAVGEIGSLTNGQLTWYVAGNHTASWGAFHESGDFIFSGTVRQTVTQNDSTDPSVPTDGYTLANLFECEQLARVVAMSLSVEINAEIDLAILENVTVVWDFWRNIQSLNGIELLTNLNRLELQNTQISDLSPLTNLTKLTNLMLANSQITDIRPLANLTNLTSLILNDNQISNLNPLASLTNLRLLDLQSNEIIDLTPLSGLTTLGDVMLANNQIRDLRPLGNLNLRTLSTRDQTVNLNPTAVGATTTLNLYWTNGTPIPLTINSAVGSFTNGQLTWHQAGNHTATWQAPQGFGAFNFTGTVHQTVTPAPFTVEVEKLYQEQPLEKPVDALEDVESDELLD